MPISAIAEAILAKLETTYGVDAVPDPAEDGVLVRSIELTEPVANTPVQRELVRSFFANNRELQGATFTKAVIVMELAGFGTAGPAAPTAGYDALLQCCGCVPDINAGTSIDYDPGAPFGEKSVSLRFYNGGKLYKGLGCVGEMKASQAVGQIPTITIELTGVYAPVSDEAMVAPDLSAYQTPLLVNSVNSSAVQLHSYAAVLAKFDFAMGNVVETRELVGSPPRVVITDRKSSGSVEIEDTLVATKNWLEIVRTAALGNFTMTHGPAGNRVVFSASRVQLKSPRPSKVQNIVHMTFDLVFLPSDAGNDEWKWSIR